MKTQTLILAFFLAFVGCSAQPQDRPILAAFVRDDCPPCVLMRPWLEEVRGAHGSRLDVAMINVDEQAGAGLAQYFGVIAIPSQVYIDGAGRVVELHAGIDTLEGLSRRAAALFEGRRTH